MTDSFWWHLLAGFILGFGVSTLWEWLYFRRKRMTIRDRYVAELEAAVRTYAAAASQLNADATGDWSEPRFEKPPVFLETEENLAEERSPEQKPSVASPFSGSVSHPQTAPRSAGSAPAPLTSMNPKLHRQGISPEQSAASSVHPKTATASFRSVAVQQSTSGSERSQAPAISQGEAYRESTFAEEPARRLEPNAALRPPEASSLTEDAPSKRAEAVSPSQRQERAGLVAATQSSPIGPAPSSHAQERPSLPEDAQQRRVEPSTLSPPQERPRSAEDESSKRVQSLTSPPAQVSGLSLTEDAQSQRVEPAISSHPQTRSALSGAMQTGRVEAVALSHPQAPPSRTEVAQAEEIELSISLRPQKDSTSLDEDAQLKRSELTASSPMQAESAPLEAERPTPMEPVTSAPAQERSSAAEASQARRTASTSSSAPYLVAAVPSETQKSQELPPIEDAPPETMQHAAASVEPSSGSPAISQAGKTGEEAAQQPFAALRLERAGATPAADNPSPAPSPSAGERRESAYFVFPNGYQAPPEASRTEPIGRENAEQPEQTRETLASAQGGVAAPQPETKPSTSMEEQTRLSPAETAPAEAPAAMAINERAEMQRERLSATTIDADQKESEPSSSGEAAACQDKVVAPPMRQDKIYTTVITSRTEWMLVRVVQAMVQFVRQVRSAITGEETPCSEPRPAHDAALCEDDLTRISGLTPAHAEQLKVVGVTQYAQLAALTVDELRMLTFTPDAAKPIDYEQWRREAASLAASQGGGRR